MEDVGDREPERKAVFARESDVLLGLGLNDCRLAAMLVKEGGGPEGERAAKRVRQLARERDRAWLRATASSGWPSSQRASPA